MNNLINQSKMLKVLSENAIDQSIDFLKDNESNDSLESEMDSYTSQISNYANSNGGVMATSIAKGVGKGVAKHTAKKAAAKGILAAMKKFGFKSIPVLGSIKAFLDIFVSAALFLKNITEFTRLLIEKTGVQPEGLTSLLGEYSFTELSGKELSKIADALESGTVTPEDMHMLWEEYKEPQRDFKDLLINICLTSKEVTGGLGFAGAITLSIIPVETGIRELLNMAAKSLDELVNSDDERGIFMDLVMKYSELLGLVSHGLPFVGWVFDADRVYQWSRIDDALSAQSKLSYANFASDLAGDTAYGATDVAYTVARVSDELGDDIGRSIDSAFKSLAENKERHVNLNRWQKLSGIN